MSGEKTPAPELRPCPFCGGPAVLREFGFDYRVGAKDVRVGCAVAFTSRGDFGDAHGRCPVAPILYSLMAPKGVDIVAAWNRRPDEELLKSRLDDALEVADGFRQTLNKALDAAAFAASAKKEGGAKDSAPIKKHGYGTPEMAGTGVVNGG